jgi:hypothetical protein
VLSSGWSDEYTDTADALRMCAERVEGGERNTWTNKINLNYICNCFRSRSSSVNIVTTLRAGRQLFDSRQGVEFCFHNRVQIGSGAKPASHRTGAGDTFPRTKRPERESDHSPPSSAEVRNAWSYSSTPYIFKTWCFSSTVKGKVVPEIN